MLTLVNADVNADVTVIVTVLATATGFVKPAVLGNVLYSAIGAAKQHLGSSAHVTAVSLTATTEPHTGSHSVLYVHDPKGRHMSVE